MEVESQGRTYVGWRRLTGDEWRRGAKKWRVLSEMLAYASESGAGFGLRARREILFSLCVGSP